MNLFEGSMVCLLLSAFASLTFLPDITNEILLTEMLIIGIISLNRGWKAINKWNNDWFKSPF